MSQPQKEHSEPHQCMQAVPAAHRGFLMRARTVPIESIYEHACRQKKRLVLSGNIALPCFVDVRTFACHLFLEQSMPVSVAMQHLALNPCFRYGKHCGAMRDSLAPDCECIRWLSRK
jgi:hypothetical protein